MFRETEDREGPPALAPGDLALPEALFVIPDGRRYVLYAPFAPGLACVNGAAVRRLTAERASLAALDPAFLAPLVESGILVSRQQAGRQAAFPAKAAFDPSGLTLYLTSQCSLACTYCYAGAGDRPRTMTWETAKVAIDWMFRNAAARGRDPVPLIFHGGGEATVAWPLLERCVTYARTEAKARGLKLSTSAGLNGVMAGPLLEWVIANIDDATLSLDGLPEVHDAQRPLKSGKGSFAVIAAALRRMDAAGFRYGLRATVTRQSVSRLVESVELMCRSFEARVIHIEPVFASRRAQANQVVAPDPQEFVREFRAAREVARTHGRELKYSGARFGTVTNNFCQVSDDLLVVTPDGLVTACYEVGDGDDERASLFVYGRVNVRSSELELNQEKLERLRTLTVEHKPSCADCFCRWSCAGECAAKLALEGNAWDTAASSRCQINRELTLDQMRDCLERGAAWPA